MIYIDQETGVWGHASELRLISPEAMEECFGSEEDPPDHELKELALSGHRPIYLPQDMYLICDAFQALIEVGGIQLEDGYLEQVVNLFDRLDPTESHHMAHIRDCIRIHTDYFKSDTPHILTPEGEDIG